MKNKIISSLLVTCFCLTLSVSAATNEEIDNTVKVVKNVEHEEFVPMKSALMIKENVKKAAEEAEKFVAEKKAEEARKAAEEAKKPKLSSLGTYKLTAYCSCSRCCGKSDGVTASGTKATQGRTVACNSLPIGTKIRINGHDYIVEDRGTSHIDVFFNSHKAALNFGVQYAEVFVYK